MSGDKKVGHLKNCKRKAKDASYAAKLVFPTSHLWGGWKSLAAWPEAAQPLTEPWE